MKCSQRKKCDADIKKKKKATATSTAMKRTKICILSERACEVATTSVKIGQPGTSGAPELLVSLGHTRRRVALGHIVNALCHEIIKKSHNALGKFMVLCGAAFIAIPSYMWLRGRRLDTPEFSHASVNMRYLWKFT